MTPSRRAGPITNSSLTSAAAGSPASSTDTSTTPDGEPTSASHPGYRRVVVEAHTATGSVAAHIYVLQQIGVEEQAPGLPETVSDPSSFPP